MTARKIITGLPVLTLVSLLGLTDSTYAQHTFDVAVDSDTRAILVSAENRIASSDAAGAYEILIAHESRLAGNAWYDYLLGVAALDTGRSGEAILALQRAIATQPGFSGARLELARAYFEIGDTGQARPLFTGLLNEQPPPAVADVISGYIAAIDNAPPPRQTRFSSYVDFASGFDSNANGSTSNDQFLGFTLNPDNVETDSAFFEPAAGFMASRPLGPQSEWYSGGRLSYRVNPSASFVDAGVASGLTGLSWRRGSWFGRGGVDGYAAMRDGDSNEAYTGLDLLIGRQLNPRASLSLGVRGGALRFDDALEALDVNRVLSTLALGVRLSPESTLQLEAVVGQDDEQRAGSPYGNDKRGARLSLVTRIGGPWLRLSVGRLQADYEGLFFGASRDDRQTTAVAELELREFLHESLTLTPRLRYVDNDSDIDLYRYERTEFRLTLRWIPE